MKKNNVLSGVSRKGMQDRIRGEWTLGVTRGLLCTLILLVADVFFVGCISKSRKLSEDEKKVLESYVVPSLPQEGGSHPIKIDFANHQVELIGYRFDPEVARTGERVKLTYYWKVNTKVGKKWLLFTHVLNGKGVQTDNLDWVGSLREPNRYGQRFGPEVWEPGKVYVDEQTYMIPEDWEGNTLTVVVGLWRGEERLKVIAGPNDGDNRGIVGTIKVEKPGSPSLKDGFAINQVPILEVPRIAEGESIVVDGQANEPAWASAATIAAFVDVGTGAPDASSPVQGSAKLAWDDGYLYVLIDIQADRVQDGFTSPAQQQGLWTVTGQPKLWLKDTAEILIAPREGDGNQDYYEIQINPHNRVFRTYYENYNTPKTDPDGPFGHEDWSLIMRSQVGVREGKGLLGTGKKGYAVEAAIAWSSFHKASRVPPNEGEIWRVNLYAMKNNGGMAWSPILGQGNFHKVSRFGKVRWVASRKNNI
ncbi:carbohydrate-binding family 9-like protein [Pajaroellobacter abortibovis]|uniref:Carbohydrate-binding domain-containing protein n=1 Tax=Pajaroellobacter abortibovis TaxID=1882918 RepID=A0A1L6MVN2_9BACT|nr:carbohydrate-binding family 9-like protein [Pajaroellobacter abortibovis]APR99599.1 hypothetical protein BCY86_02070 [Pajaroellobacter abortibovis]